MIHYWEILQKLEKNLIGNRKQILNFWLKSVPEYAIIFTRLTLINLLIGKYTFEITNSIRAIGKIKEFQITETIIGILNVPITYMLFKYEFPPSTVYTVAIFLSLILSIYRLYIGKKIANAKSRFPSKEDCFFYGINEGDSYTIGGWINETTSARFN